MRKVFYTALLSVILFSCQQDNPPDPNPTTCNEPATRFSFKIDGTLVEMNGSLSNNSKVGAVIRKTKDYRAIPTGCAAFSASYDPNCQKYIYILSATYDNLWDDEWNTALRFRLPSLIQGQTYSKSTFNTDWAVFRYPIELDGGFGTANMTLTITKLINGYADGTFSGSVYKSVGGGYGNITEGSFTNVKVLQ